MKNKNIYLLLLLLLYSISISSNHKFEGYPLTREGAWCWFADSRALHFKSKSGKINASYIGYIDTHGNIKATQLDYITGQKKEVLIRSFFQPDDHNNPTFLVLPNERIMIIYSRHTDEPCFYYRISRKPGDITSLGKEMKIKTNHNTTYPSPFILSDDPNHFYLCWRGIKWHPTLAKYTLPDAQDRVTVKWGPHQIVQSSGARPYAKYHSNGKDKIFMTYTTGHPDNEHPNWIYFNVINLHAKKDATGQITTTPQLEDIKGNKLCSISTSTFKINKTTNYKNKYPYTIVDAPEQFRDWVWQLTYDNRQHPIIGMVRISGDKKQHDYFYAKWTGKQWKLTALAQGGGRFHPSNTEYCYSGGIAIDPNHPHITYLSIPTVGTSGKSTFEIWKYTLNNKGRIKTKQQITYNSNKNNIRPFVLPGASESQLRLAWMHGDYDYWLVTQKYPLGFPTGIHCDYPQNKFPVDLQKDLILKKNYAGQTMTPGQTEKVSLAQCKTFTISLNLLINDSTYYGTLLSTENLSYQLTPNHALPSITLHNTTYHSTNRLYTSDHWALYSRGTGGDNWPTPLKTFNLTVTYNGKELTVYRNGWIDQCIEAKHVTANKISIGGYQGKLYDIVLYNRALKQEEVKQLFLSIETNTTH